MQTFVTVLTRTDGRAAGKTFDARGKHVANHAGQYHARTVTLTGSKPAQLLTAYADFVSSLSVSQSIILGHAPDMPVEYEIRPQSQLPGDGQGVYLLVGKPTIARLKSHFEPSRILLLDFDPDSRMPDAWQTLDESGRWALLGAALPEFAGAARLALSSGSARVWAADGSPIKSGPLGTHTYVVTDRPLSTPELDRARVCLLTRLWAADLGFFAHDKNDKPLVRALFDSSVWTAGREVFDAAPCVKPPYQLATLTTEIHDGGLVSIVTTPDDATLAEYNARTGARVIRKAIGKATGTPPEAETIRLVIEDHKTLRLDTTVVTEKGPLTIRQFLNSKHAKLRCQATFRESSSWAGILRKTPHGGCVLHDVGMSISYRLGGDPQTLSGDLVADLDTLRGEHPANAQGTARALLWRHAWRAPIKFSWTALLNEICSAHASVDRADLKAIVGHLEAKARKTATAAVTIDAPALASNVIFHACPDIDAVRRGIEAAGGGIHLSKSPHGSGKTQSLLRPIALQRNGVVAIAPRVSLVSDLATRLDLAHYQGASTDPDTAICLNSVVNGKYAGILADARAVLVDEIGAIVRECHNPHSTLKKKARAAWTRLTDMLLGAEIAVGVDADLSTAHINMIAAAIPSRTVHLWVVTEAPRPLVATFASEDVMLAQLHEAVAAGERVLFVSDNAKRVAGLALELAGRYPDKRILGIHDKKGTSTKGTQEAQALLSDINTECSGYDVLLLSPTVESGVSLQTAHFTRHFALYSGTVAPSALNQQVLRDRTSKQWTIAIEGHGFKNLPDTIGEALNGLHAAARRVLAIDGRTLIEPATPFDFDCCRTIAVTNEARNSYGASLWYLLEARGWTVARGSQAKSEDGKALRRAAQEAIEAATTTAICNAPDLPAKDVAALRESYTLTPEQSAIVARADVREATGITHEPIMPDAVDAWQDGKLDGQNRLFADLTTAPGLSERDRADAEARVSLGLRSFDAARGDAVRALFAALGLNHETGAGTVTDATARAAYHALKGTENAAVLTHFGICRFTKASAYALRWANEALGKLGLYLVATKHAGKDGKDGRTYSVGLDVKRDKNGRFLLPGWALMVEIQERRRWR